MNSYRKLELERTIRIGVRGDRRSEGSNDYESRYQRVNNEGGRIRRVWRQRIVVAGRGRQWVHQVILPACACQSHTSRLSWADVSVSAADPVSFRPVPQLYSQSTSSRLSYELMITRWKTVSFCSRLQFLNHSQCNTLLIWLVYRGNPAGLTLSPTLGRDLLLTPLLAQQGTSTHGKSSLTLLF